MDAEVEVVLQDGEGFYCCMICLDGAIEEQADKDNPIVTVTELEND
jgi:hypothetical protein